MTSSFIQRPAAQPQQQLLGQPPEIALPWLTRSSKAATKEGAKKQNQRGPSSPEIKQVLALLGQGRFTDVERLTRLLVARFPKYGFGWKVLGAVVNVRKEHDEALECFKKAAALMPDDAETHFNLGVVLQLQAQHAQAVISLRRAVELKPDDALAHSNLGLALLMMGRYAEAEISLRQAEFLHPDSAKNLSRIGFSLQAQGQFTEGIRYLKKALEAQPDLFATHSSLLFCMSNDVWTDAQQLHAAHLAFGERYEAPLRSGWQTHTNTKDPERCLQIGFVSGDLYNHAVASFLEPVLEFFAKKKGLSLHAYYTYTIEDAVTQRLRPHFAHWHAVAQLDDAELAQNIRADGIDILIDLSGHTDRNRLLTFARKPAPVQVSWIGYPGTTGLQAIDYYLCDRFLIPEELAWQFTEKMAYMPSGAIFQPNQDAPSVNALPAMQNGYITFGSFNRAAKLNDATIALWCLLLQAVPNARMVLAGLAPENQHGLNQRFAQNQIDLNRLTFYPRTDLAEYLTLHHQVDFCLDTFPYGGGTTTCHAAWMGVPTLTLSGETGASRPSACIMSHWGLNDFIANDIEDFVDKGVYWSKHFDELAAIRLSMRDRYHACAMGQPEALTDHLETALRAMWQRWCVDLPAVSFDVMNKE